MFRRLSLAAITLLAVALVAEEAFARNPAYYGTRRQTSARVYSGQYQAFRPNVVPTFSVPFYGGGRSFYRGRGFYGRGVYGQGFYQQPVVIYPPAISYGF